MHGSPDTTNAINRRPIPHLGVRRHRTRLARSPGLAAMTRQSIVIVGGGFAGVHAAIGAVATLGGAQHRVSVELVNPSPFQTIKPRLYERDLSGVQVPLADILDPVGVMRHEATVIGIDTEKRRLSLDNGSTLGYDQLVIAAGSRLELPAAPNVYCTDSFEQATELRHAVEEWRDRQGRFRAVVVGGGFTGMEVAAELAADAQVTLVSSGGVAPGYGEKARDAIQKALSTLGVTISVGTADEVLDGAVLLTDGTRIEAELVVWAAGPRANPLTRQIPADRDQLGRLLVDDYLRVIPGVWAAGDSANAKVSDAHHAVMSCQHATPQGRRAGQNAAAAVLGHRPRRYRQPAYLTCLALGQFGAVLTSGFDRNRVLASAQDAAQVKRAVNHGLLYPRGHTREQLLKSGTPAPPSGPVGATLMITALRSRRVRAKFAAATPTRSLVYTGQTPRPALPTANPTGATSTR